MTRVLLITGARSLADDRAAEARARGLIAAALVGVDLLLVGDAPGPDAWAWETTYRLAIVRTMYCTRGELAGMRARINSPLLPSTGDAFDVTERTPEGTSTHPLRRNAAMVATARANMLRGHTVSVLALLDGRKPAVTQPGEKRPTRGTEHTARLARAAGLTVDAQTWGSR